MNGVMESQELFQDIRGFWLILTARQPVEGYYMPRGYYSVTRIWEVFSGPKLEPVLM